MAEDRGILKMFGFQLTRVQKNKEEKDRLPSIVPPTDEEGSGYTTASGAYFGQYVNIDGGDSKNHAQLINQYRGVAMHPEVDEAIDNIVNEAVTSAEEESSVTIKLDKVKLSSGIKKKITDEFDGVVSMLNFNELGYEIFKRWYVDGRLYHHLIVEKGKEKNGIVDIRPIDAAKIRKVKEVKTKKDELTGAKIIDSVVEYFIYQDKPGHQSDGVKLTADSVSYIASGLLDQDRKRVISYLHTALKAINQLRMMEDSLVIYRLARAPERRVFYIDIGNLPKGKAEEYMKNIMTRYRNKIVYDAETGNIKDDRKHMSMLEDFWLPRREGGRGTEITTLPGGENLGQIEDIIYFQKKLYRSLKVPISRMDTENTPFNIGRGNEISRDELRFQKFIDRLRTRFSGLFLEILHKQLILKGILTDEDWDDIKNDIVVDFMRDNYFTELKETEILRERLGTLQQVNDYVGIYFSRAWVQKNILRLDEDDIEQMQKELDAEAVEAEAKGTLPNGAPLPPEPEEEPEPPPPPPAPAVNVTVNHPGDKPKGKVKKESVDVDDQLRQAELKLMNELTDFLKEK